MSKSVTKPGKHGTLILYSITYTDPSDDCVGELTQRLFAYNVEHALIRFYEAIDSDGWRALRIARVLSGLSQHRAIQHEVS